MAADRQYHHRELTLPVPRLLSSRRVEYLLLMAGALMAVILMLMLFIIFQRYFIRHRQRRR